MSTDAEENAIKRLCDINYHRSLWLPATAQHGKLRVTYATSRNFDNKSLPVLLFIPPMFCSRMHIIAMDQLAQESGVRLVSADRPGMGGSTPVDLAIRMDVWLETVPILLEKLDIKHVSLASHSAGTTYLLNTLYSYRSILEPAAPYAAMLAPWVETTQSKSAIGGILSKLPSGIVKGWHGLASFVTSISPAVQWSSGLPGELIDLFKPTTIDATTDNTPEAEKYGCDNATAKEMSKLAMKYLWAEETKALNDEALFCLHRGGIGSWKACEDYAGLAKTLAEREKEASPTVKLTILAYFASSDLLIGSGGQKYIEECFDKMKDMNSVDFQSIVKPDTNHESVIADRKKGALVQVFQAIGQQKTSQ